MAKSARKIDTEFERESESAVREAREADRIEPRANTIRYEAQLGLILVELRSGFVFGFSPERIPGLSGASSKDLAGARISPSGDGLHWGDLDVDVSLTGLVADGLNLRDWAPRFMDQVRSDAKARAARLNGMKGGRPKRATSATKRSKKSTRS
jgi:hypothetical protein